MHLHYHNLNKKLAQKDGILSAYHRELLNTELNLKNIMYPQTYYYYFLKKSVLFLQDFSTNLFFFLDWKIN